MTADNHGGEIVSDPGIHGGEPILSGTRITAGFVASLIRDGLDNDEIRVWYPSATDGHIEAIRDDETIHRTALEGMTRELTQGDTT